jgi:hypothetical protein
VIRTGDLVDVTYNGRTVEGVVQLASTNGRSLMLSFDAMLGGYVGQMPVLDADGSGEYRDLMTSTVVQVVPRRKPQAPTH